MQLPHSVAQTVCHPARHHAPVAILALAALGPDGGRLPGLYDAYYLGTRLLVARTRQPFLDGTRALLALGFDPATAVVLKHIGSDTECQRGRIGTAAGLTVEESDIAGIRLRRWKPYPSRAVAPPTAPMVPALAEGPPEQFGHASAGRA
jgi:hypothetical protein